MKVMTRANERSDRVVTQERVLGRPTPSDPFPYAILQNPFREAIAESKFAPQVSIECGDVHAEFIEISMSRDIEGQQLSRRPRDQ
ncbi:MAG: hypothetical protein ACREM3_04905 [Candidatus Rokuibacteriota bacterium]